MSFIEKNEEHEVPAMHEKVALIIGLAGVGVTYFNTPADAEQLNIVGIIFAVLLFALVAISALMLRNTPQHQRGKRILVMVPLDILAIMNLLLGLRIFF